MLLHSYDSKKRLRLGRAHLQRARFRRAFGQLEMQIESGSEVLCKPIAKNEEILKPNESLEASGDQKEQIKIEAMEKLRRAADRLVDRQVRNKMQVDPEAKAIKDEVTQATAQLHRIRLNLNKKKLSLKTIMPWECIMTD